MNLSWFIARHYLRARGRGRLLSFITWVALGGVSLGVAALVLVIGVMTGMQDELREKILEVQPHIIVFDYGGDIELGNWRAVADSLRALEDVTAVTPYVISAAMMQNQDGYPQAMTLWGFPTDSLEAEASTPLIRQFQTSALSLSDPLPGDPPSIVVGSRLAERMGLLPGSEVEVAVLGTDFHAFLGLLPISRQFRVSDIVETGMYEYDADYAYAALDVAQDFLGLHPDTVSGLGISITDPWHARAVSEVLDSAIWNTFGKQLVVVDWTEQNQDLFAALRLEKIAMGVILFLIVVVAAFNIVSTLVMVVVDRTREIGILKSMGMTRERILWVFMLQGAWIGVVGTLVGVTVGAVLGWAVDRFQIIDIPPEVYFVDRLPVHMEFVDIGGIVLASLAVAFLATIYPALQASRLQPVDAIRHE